MNIFNLNYQVSLFGDYTNVTPSVENIKKIFDLFAGKGMIPSQFNELRLISGTPRQENRLRLSTPDNSCNINFNSDRLDIILTDINLKVFKMKTFEEFIAETKEYIVLINSIFPINHRRIGIVRNLLVNDIDANVVQKKLTNNIPLFDGKELGEWSNRISTRQILNKEVINIVSDIRRIKTPINMDSKQTIFDGVLLNMDVNTVDENKNYRFKIEGAKSIIDDLSHIQNQVSEQTLQHIR